MLFHAKRLAFQAIFTRTQTSTGYDYTYIIADTCPNSIGNEDFVSDTVLRYIHHLCDNSGQVCSFFFTYLVCVGEGRYKL